MGQRCTGVFSPTKKGAGALRMVAQSFRVTPQDPLVPPALVREHGLVAGALVEGEVENGTLRRIDTICGLAPEAFAARKNFGDLVAVDPSTRFDLAASGNTSMRVMDLVAPIGKGTRGLIVSPPKAGKTVLLEQIASAIRAADTEARIILLLIDERPEEVTHFRRSLDAEVLASSSDQTVTEHIALAELTLAHIRCELECGRDVVVLVDSLTRMGRAFNLQGGGKGRMMSGGVEAGALEIPRRFFGAARAVEGGGSVTIIASCLVDTGSRMDQLIFEEFKGTGNSELILDRSLAEQRLFPAIDLAASGTRKEVHLYGEADAKRVGKLRRALADRQPKEALSSLLSLLEKHPTNRAFLDTIPV